MAGRSILIVDDEAPIREMIAVALEMAGYDCIEAENSQQAHAIIVDRKPDLILLDWMLPGTSGIELARRLKRDELTGDIPIIMLTSKSSEEERIAGFALGADDYVVKPFSPRELVYRVKALLKRALKEDLSSVEPMSFSNGSLMIDGHSYTVKKHGEAVAITPTEFKVLFTLASAPGKVFTREELVDKALGYQFEGYERSIDAHIKNIRHKIEDDPKNPVIILTIYGVGYRFSSKKNV